MILVLDKFETISENRVHTEAKRKSISTFFVIHDSIHHSLRWERIIKISTIVFPNPPASPSTWKPHETMRLDFFHWCAHHFSLRLGSNRPTLWFVESDQSGALSKCQTNVKHATRASRSPCAVNRWRSKESDLLNRCRLSGRLSIIECYLTRNILFLNWRIELKLFLIRFCYLCYYAYLNVSLNFEMLVYLCRIWM